MHQSFYSTRLSVQAQVGDKIGSLDDVLREVTACVARDFGIDTGAVLSPTRGAPRAAFARQVAMYLAHVGFALNFETVGRMFGRDRTTVSHACRVVEDERDDAWLDGRLAALEARYRPESAPPQRQGPARRERTR